MERERERAGAVERSKIPSFFSPQNRRAWRPFIGDGGLTGWLQVGGVVSGVPAMVAGQQAWEAGRRVQGKETGTAWRVAGKGGMACAALRRENYTWSFNL